MDCIAYLSSIAGNRRVHPASCNLLMAKDVLMSTLSKISPCAVGLCPLGPAVCTHRSEGVPSYCRGNRISEACGDGGEAQFQLKEESDDEGKIITSRGIMDCIISCIQTLLPPDVKFILEVTFRDTSSPWLGICQRFLCCLCPG